mmetsp:Transcript_1961/g.4854  ORF Transcript_1961/g.4854 Transcript_1961/m.4854 type:complete len:289 (-) Transcript_1961:175-1041(-)
MTAAAAAAAAFSTAPRLGRFRGPACPRGFVGLCRFAALPAQGRLVRFSRFHRSGIGLPRRQIALFIQRNVEFEYGPIVFGLRRNLLAMPCASALSTLNTLAPTANAGASAILSTLDTLAPIASTLSTVLLRPTSSLTATATATAPEVGHGRNIIFLLLRATARLGILLIFLLCVVLFAFPGPLQASHLLNAAIGTVLDQYLPIAQKLLLAQSHVWMSDAVPLTIEEVSHDLLLLASAGTRAVVGHTVGSCWARVIRISINAVKRWRSAWRHAVPGNLWHAPALKQTSP